MCAAECWERRPDRWQATPENENGGVFHHPAVQSVIPVSVQVTDLHAPQHGESAS